MAEDMAPGWYPDGSGQDRWWNGNEWTKHFRTASSADDDLEAGEATAPLPVIVQSTATTSTSTSVTKRRAGAWYGKRWLIAAVALVVGIVIGMSGSWGSSDPKQSDQNQSLSATNSSATEDLSTAQSDLADARAEAEALKSQLADAKDAEAAAQKKLKAAQEALDKATPTPTTPAKAPSSPKTHACTKTSTGSCIKGGDACQRSQYGQTGYDAAGRKFTCTGSHIHPHWE
jgi:hypothetical protein